MVVCGPQEAVVSGEGALKPYVFIVRGSSYITLAGFSVTAGIKGAHESWSA